MELVERSLSALSSLKHEIFGVLDGERDTHIQVVRFTGEYRVGSRGENDAAYMRGVALLAVSAWDTACLVLDLRELEYSWGHSLLGVIEAPGELHDEEGDPGFPVLVVASDRCRAGLESLLGSAPPPDGRPQIFDSLDDALAAAGKAVRDYLAE
jgi:hypothetical protein